MLTIIIFFYFITSLFDCPPFLSTAPLRLPPGSSAPGSAVAFLLGERHKDGSPTRGLGHTTGRRLRPYDWTAGLAETINQFFEFSSLHLDKCGGFHI